MKRCKAVVVGDLNGSALFNQAPEKKEERKKRRKVRKEKQEKGNHACRKKWRVRKGNPGVEADRG